MLRRGEIPQMTENLTSEDWSGNQRRKITD